MVQLQLRRSWAQNGVLTMGGDEASGTLGVVLLLWLSCLKFRWMWCGGDSGCASGSGGGRRMSGELNVRRVESVVRGSSGTEHTQQDGCSCAQHVSGLRQRVGWK